MPVAENERTSATDPDFAPPAAVEAVTRTWERLLAERYPGTQWTVTYDADDD